MVSLMKQARAFGVGVVVATQNPMDLDYRALGNAGLWCVGRLQTEADCERVLDGMASMQSGQGPAELGRVIKKLASMYFLIRDVHATGGPMILQPRCAMSMMRGPMTRGEIAKALQLVREERSQGANEEQAGGNAQDGVQKDGEEGK
jgi:hypothetical protein